MSCWLDNQEAWLSQAMWIVLGRSTDLSQLDATGSCLIKSPGFDETMVSITLVR